MKNIFEINTPNRSCSPLGSPPSKCFKVIKAVPLPGSQGVRPSAWISSIPSDDRGPDSGPDSQGKRSYPNAQRNAFA